MHVLFRGGSENTMIILSHTTINVRNIYAAYVF